MNIFALEVEVEPMATDPPRPHRNNANSLSFEKGKRKRRMPFMVFSVTCVVMSRTLM